MYVDADTLDDISTFHLLSGSVSPRPIAWITSGGLAGPVNLAPFSAFTWVSQRPAMLGITVSRREDGRKDTIINVERDREFVVNIPSETLLEVMHLSSERMPPEVSEAAVLGLPITPSTKVRVPRLADALVSMECVYDTTVTFGRDGGEFLVGTVVAWHVDDTIVDGFHIAPELLRPVGRLAGPRYVPVDRIIERPPVSN